MKKSLTIFVCLLFYVYLELRTEIAALKTKLNKEVEKQSFLKEDFEIAKNLVSLFFLPCFKILTEVFHYALYSYLLCFYCFGHCKKYNK